MTWETSPGETQTTNCPFSPNRAAMTDKREMSLQVQFGEPKGLLTNRSRVTQRQLIVYSPPQHGEDSESCNLELRAYLVGRSTGCRVTVPQQLLAVYTTAGGARLVFLSFSLQRGSFSSVEMFSHHHTPKLRLLTQKQKAEYNFREGLVVVFNIYLICLAGVGGVPQSSCGSQRTLAGVSCHAGSRNRTQVIRLSCRRLYIISLLLGPLGKDV